MQHTFVLVAKDTTDSGMGIISIDRQNDMVYCAEFEEGRQYAAKRVQIRYRQATGHPYICRTRVGTPQRQYYLSEFQKPQRGQIYGGKEH